MDDYRIQLAAFEGPLDLLMHLIEKNKIDIYDIPIAELTRQYMEHLNRMRELDMEIASSFLVMAATLLQIKSRMMLPQQSKEKETAEEDPRQELVARLLEYKKFQQVSELLQGQAVSEARFCAREPLDLPTHHVLAAGFSRRFRQCSPCARSFACPTRSCSLNRSRLRRR